MQITTFPTKAEMAQAAAKRAADLLRDGIARKGRPPMPELPVEERVHSFDESELTLTEEQALKEAGRCLQCGLTCYWRDDVPRVADAKDAA